MKLTTGNFSLRFFWHCCQRGWLTRIISWILLFAGHLDNDVAVVVVVAVAVAVGVLIISLSS